MGKPMGGGVHAICLLKPVSTMPMDLCFVADISYKVSHDIQLRRQPRAFVGYREVKATKEDIGGLLLDRCLGQASFGGPLVMLRLSGPRLNEIESGLEQAINKTEACGHIIAICLHMSCIPVHCIMRNRVPSSDYPLSRCKEKDVCIYAVCRVYTHKSCLSLCVND